MFFKRKVAQFFQIGGRPWLQIVVVSCLLLPSASSWSWGQDISFIDSPEWKPFDAAQTERLQKVAVQSYGQFVDAAGYIHGGGAMVMKVPMREGVNSQSTRNYVAGMIHGVSESGQKLQSQEPTNVGPLPGSLLTFEGTTNGRPSSIVAYVVFDAQNAYVFSISGPAGMTKTSPEVTSYLARVKFSPSLVPPDLHNSAYEAGEQAGRWLGRGIVVGVVIVVIFALLRRRKKRQEDSLPPPLPP